MKYSTVHSALGRKRGPAKDHACLICGVPAQQWAYDNNDPDEKSELINDHTHKGGRIGKLAFFSTKLEHYEPLCIRCHKTRDRSRASMEPTRQ